MAKDMPASPPTDPLQALIAPTVRLYGPVDETMLGSWIQQTSTLQADGKPVIVELSTVGGDAEIGRRIADDVRLLRDAGRSLQFFGKTMVYSAGATIMGGFLRQERWLSRDAVVMVHGRKLSKCLTFSGTLRAERAGVQALLAEIDDGLRLEALEFGKFIAGSDVTRAEIEGRTMNDWYIPAEEALSRGLIAGVV